MFNMIKRSIVIIAYKRIESPIIIIKSFKIFKQRKKKFN